MDAWYFYFDSFNNYNLKVISDLSYEVSNAVIDGIADFADNLFDNMILWQQLAFLVCLLLLCIIT